jgi:uncharacterized protein
VKLSLTSLVPVDRERVFAALVDPGMLRRAIPGCESLSETGPGEYAATLKVGLAGLKGTYSGKAAIRNPRAPDSLTITVDGKGLPGFVRGSADLVLTAEADMTRVACTADVQVGGVIAAVGSRLVEAGARKMADDFFKQLTIALTAQDV